MSAALVAEAFPMLADMSPTGVEADVCEDIARRQRLGIAKYGTTVAQNPLSLRAWLQHAYEESLDQAVYLRRAIAEIDSASPPLTFPHLEQS